MKMIDKEKVRELAETLKNSYVNRYENVITEWLEQNQPEPVVVWLSDEKAELEQLKSPNWDDAPENADEVCVTLHWSDKDSNIVKQTILLQENRPKPTPQVEVGQVWKHSNGGKYQIDSIGEIKVNDNLGWIDCVTYRSLETGKFYTRMLSDFLANFERING